ncbi:MAG TPA: hypothetical protein VHO24_11075 [Opitutaceae bacterium]|nr:hypothetical protein [Opitutaceae bacterium]
MPAKYIIDVPHRVVFSQGTGVFTHGDFIGHMEALQKNPAFNPDFSQVVDCRDIGLLDLKNDQLRDLAAQSIFSLRARRAFVVSTELHFGMSRMFAAYRELAGQQVAVFKDMPSALQWLGLPPDLDPHAPTS